MNVNPVDITFLLLWLFFIYRGFRTGFIQQLGQIVSIIAGYIAANQLHLIAFDYLIPYIPNPSVRNVLSYILLFIVTVVIIQIIAKIISKLINLILLGWLDKLLGMMLGLLKAIFISTILIFLIEAFPQSADLRERLKQDSLLYGICDTLKEWTIQALSSDELLYRIQHELREKTDEKYIRDLLKNTDI